MSTPPQARGTGRREPGRVAVLDGLAEPGEVLDADQVQIQPQLPGADGIADRGHAPVRLSSAALTAAGAAIQSSRSGWRAGSPGRQRREAVHSGGDAARPDSRTDHGPWAGIAGQCDAERRLGMPTESIGICEPMRAEHLFGRGMAWRLVGQSMGSKRLVSGHRPLQRSYLVPGRSR